MRFLLRDPRSSFLLREPRSSFLLRDHCKRRRGVHPYS